MFEIEKDGRVKTGGVGGLDGVIAAAGRGLMGFEDSVALHLEISRFVR